MSRGKIILRLITLGFISVIVWNNFLKPIEWGNVNYDEVRFELAQYQVKHAFNGKTDYSEVIKYIDKLPLIIFQDPETENIRYIYARTKNNIQLYLRYDASIHEMQSIGADEFVKRTTTINDNGNILYQHKTDS